MQKILLSLLLILPFVVVAHGDSTSFEDAGTPAEMMRFIEDTALGEELHEEMEELMEKMMSGTMDQGEAEHMAELMQENPGPHGMMMGRIGMMGGFGPALSGGGMFSGHMSGGYGLAGWLFSLIPFVWLIVGLLVIVLLIKKINTK